MIYSTIKQLSRPIMAHLELTNHCNHRCIHCYRLDSDITNRHNDDVDDDRIISNVIELINNGILHVIITGGEPLEKKELVEKIVLLAKQQNVTVSLNTNLTLADDDVISFLRETETRILVSCPSAIQSSYEAITLTKNFHCFRNNLSKVIDAGIKTAVNMVVTKDNLSEIKVTAEMIHQLGCTAFCVTPVALNMDYPKPQLLLSEIEIEKLVTDIIWVESAYNMKVDILDGLPKCVFPSNVLSEEHLFLYRRCQAGRTFIAVSPNGDVRPCANSSFSYGNLHTVSLKEIWDRMSYWRSEEIIPTECKGCLWINRCLGGCRTNAKALTNKWNGTDIWNPKPILSEPPSHSKTVDLRDDTVLWVAEGLQIREEYEGVYLLSCTQNRTFCMVNQSIVDFIKLVQNLKKISFFSIRTKYAKNADTQKITEIIIMLIRYKILKY